jgi:hypothetical protein
MQWQLSNFYKVSFGIFNNNKMNNYLVTSTMTNVELVSPAKIYINAKLLKDDILKDNNNQSGIYR